MYDEPGANSRVARVRRGHDGRVCVAKTITADHAVMAVTELSAYADLPDHSNIVRIVECFYDETFCTYCGSFFVLQACGSMLNVSLNLP